MKRLNQRGTGIIEVLFILVIIGAIGTAGWYVWRHHKNASPVKSSSTKGASDAYIQAGKIPVIWDAVNANHYSVTSQNTTELGTTFKQKVEFDVPAELAGKISFLNSSYAPPFQFARNQYLSDPICQQAWQQVGLDGYAYYGAALYVYVKGGYETTSKEDTVTLDQHYAAEKQADGDYFTDNNARFYKVGGQYFTSQINTPNLSAGSACYKKYATQISSDNALFEQMFRTVHVSPVQ